LAEQEAAVPPFVPAHVHAHGPVPLTEDAEPAPQRPEVGALPKVVPFDAPQLPFTGVGARLAEQEDVAPPFEPEHDQAHGPEPLTDEAEPAPQRPEVGMLFKVRPLDEPQLPSTGVGAAKLAEQDADVPPLEPEHVQPQGPEPLTDEAEPVLQKPDVGMLLRVAPSDAPHVPFTAVSCCWVCEGAEQDASLPL
jgi:hypothetical protein